MPEKPWSKIMTLMGIISVCTSDPARGGRLENEELNNRNDFVYEVDELVPGTAPSVEIVFFHGLQLTEGGDDDLYKRTWMSEDDKELWPKWLKDPGKFPDARILITSYDAWAQRNATKGCFDGFNLAETLLNSLILADVGQSGCPVILVGHGVGCLILKAVCERAHMSSSLNGMDKEKLDFFLHHIRGMFYFSPVSHGAEFFDKLHKVIRTPGPWLEISKTLSNPATRLGETFRRMRQDKYKRWKTWAVAETQPTNVQTQLEDESTAEPLLFHYNDVMVQEASSRFDVDKYMAISADHYNVSRPAHRNSLSFLSLVAFVTELCTDPEMGEDLQSVFEELPETFGLEGLLQKLEEWLSEEPRTQYIGFAGMGGIGKTILAKSFFRKICSRFEYACVLDLDILQESARVTTERSLKTNLLAEMHRWGRKTPFKPNWTALTRKKVLILLDDVQSSNQILDAKIPHGFGPGSCVMATSRDRSILENSGYRIHDVEELSEGDSRKLFRHAFYGTEPMYQRMMVHAQELIKLCSGLPLALEEVSKSLSSVKIQRVWEDMVTRVKCADSLNGHKTCRLWDSLNRSLTSLAETESRMFVDLATLFHGEEAEDVVAAWEVVHPGVGYSGCWHLLKRSLAKCSGDLSALPSTEESCCFRKGTRLVTKHNLLKYLGERQKHLDLKYEQGTVHVFDEATAKQLRNLQLWNSQAIFNNIHTMKIDRRVEAIDLRTIFRFRNLKVLWLKEVSLWEPNEVVATLGEGSLFSGQRLQQLLEMTIGNAV